jgi:hypothetical protein
MQTLNPGNPKILRILVKTGEKRLNQDFYKIKRLPR